MSLCKKAAVLLVAGLTLAVFVACSSLPRAESDFNTDYDFSQVKTYNFINREKLRQMTPLTDDITRNRIENAIERNLNKRGFVYQKDAAKADTLVSYHLTTKDKQDIRSYNVGVRHCWHCGWGMAMKTTEFQVRDYVEGTLIIDMINPVKDESVWRGLLTSRVVHLKTQQERIDSINFAVDEILSKYPPLAAIK